MRGHRLATWAASTGGFGAGLCLAGIVCAGTLQVFFRYALNAPLSWPEEVSRLLLVWLTYVGALVLPESRHHVAVDVFYARMPPRARHVADLLADLLAVAFFGALALGGVGLVGAMGGIRLPALQLPLNLIFGLIPIVGVLQVYVHVVAVIRWLGGDHGTPGPDR